MRKIDAAEYREGTRSRLRTHIRAATAHLEALEYQLDAGGDCAQTAEALSTTTDRILEQAAVLRALDAVKGTT